MALGYSLLRAGIAALFASTSANAATLEIVGSAETFAPDIASTQYSEVRLTLSPDGRTALWFSRDRPGGPGGYDIWISHRSNDGWSPATAVPFNSPGRDFDPAFSPDGAFVYFCSDRAGGAGGDDVYRVRFARDGFGALEHLGPEVNSHGNEFAPMLSADSSTLIFSSDRAGGAGRQDLFRSRHRDGRFEVAERLPGEINTGGDEFDATLLGDGSTLIFARAGDFRTDRVDLFVATLRDGRYDVGRLLPPSINMPDKDTYGPMLDWSGPDRFTFSAQRAGSRSMDLYVVSYRLNDAKR